jgi:hypothetical protein
VWHEPLLTTSTVAVALLFATSLGRWSTRLGSTLVRWAAAILPADTRNERQEEWLAELETIPSGLSQILWGLGLMLSAGRLRWGGGSEKFGDASERDLRHLRRHRWFAVASATVCSLAIVAPLSTLAFTQSGISAKVLLVAGPVTILLTAVVTVLWERRDKDDGGPGLRAPVRHDRDVKKLSR